MAFIRLFGPCRQAGNWLEIDIERDILAASQAGKNKLFVGLGYMGNIN
jgi:hypothetical protein